ncbi:hypothetical protein AKG60_24695 [Vibrio parahaemolyticus]|uniref:Uncharacterized protein n=1 Tax=Vibrio parahaemolyticus TaxID=670 RepID=A0AAX0M6L1_VIBPH|nr:hypothetical protein [Vibrio vulnificus]EGQ8301954.1 hypothetical protein [Vibrio parahaemolyticus]MCS0330443.1 hypothetical protein [Vibrio diabolicus]ARN69701.1 hypothetical protein FORC36_5184 [Vibrio vulnificus]EGQ8891269.1 hypothetical protein [Vibrio parahaemolyticus]EJG0024273.1 hypothetical protein [Vibrio parahaemolyticus]
MESSSLFNKTEQELIGIAVNQLSSVCDMAAKKDGLGFNKPDARKGHHLAALPLDEWTELDYAFCWAILFKYQTQLESIFKTSISELYKEKLKGVKKEDIPKVLMDVRDKLRERINEKHLVLFSEDAFILVYNDIKYSPNVDDAFKFLNAEKVEGETNTKWIVKNTYCRGFEYIAKKLIGLDNLHFCKGAYNRLREGFEGELTLNDLLRSGFDERDVIFLNTSEDSEPVTLEIKARNSYKEAKKLTRYEYIKDENKAVAQMAFLSDYRVIITLANALKFKLKVDGEPVNLRQFMDIAKPKMVKPDYFNKTVSGKTVTITDEKQYLSIPKAPGKGLSMKRDGNTYTFAVFSEKGLRSIYSFMQSINCDLRDKDIVELKNNLLNKDIVADGSSGKSAPKKDANKTQNLKSLRREGDNVYVKFPYSPTLVDLIKKNVDPNSRKYEPSTQEWMIKDDLLTSKFVQSLQEDHGFQWS